MSELIQHDLHIWARKTPAKWKTKSRRASLERNHYTDRIEQQRPHTTGALLGQIWKVDGAPVLPSWTATVPFSPSSFCHFPSSSTCYHCLFDKTNGREFCEIMGRGYCTTCIKTNRRKENDEEVINALGTSVTERFASLFGDTILRIKRSPTLASSTGRELFNRLNNFNSNSEYYVNPTNGIRSETLQVISDDRDYERQLPGQSKSSVLQATGSESPNYASSQGVLGTVSKKRRRKGVSGKTRRQFRTFNGLPIEPPLITVDLSNQIMNQLVINDS